MPWTIPNLLLHDKPLRLGNMRRLGRNHVFVNCGNPDCFHNAELDVSRFPDDMTFNDLQPLAIARSMPARYSSGLPPERRKARLISSMWTRWSWTDSAAFASSISLRAAFSGSMNDLGSMYLTGL